MCGHPFLPLPFPRNWTSEESSSSAHCLLKSVSTTRTMSSIIGTASQFAQEAPRIYGRRWPGRYILRNPRAAMVQLDAQSHRDADAAAAMQFARLQASWSLAPCKRIRGKTCRLHARHCSTTCTILKLDLSACSTGSKRRTFRTASP